VEGCLRPVHSRHTEINQKHFIDRLLFLNQLTDVFRSIKPGERCVNLDVILLELFDEGKLVERFIVYDENFVHERHHRRLQMRAQALISFDQTFFQALIIHTRHAFVSCNFLLVFFFLRWLQNYKALAFFV